MPQGSASVLWILVCFPMQSQVLFVIQWSRVIVQMSWTLSMSHRIQHVELVSGYIVVHRYVRWRLSHAQYVTVYLWWPWVARGNVPGCRPWEWTPEGCWLVPWEALLLPEPAARRGVLLLLLLLRGWLVEITASLLFLILCAAWVVEGITRYISVHGWWQWWWGCAGYHIS